MKTTSIHRLNGDRKLGLSGRLAYLPLNWLNNRFPESRVDPRLDIRDFQCPNLGSLWPEIGTGMSPSRTLSDLFWLTLPWERIRDQLGTIRILDVGCGNGQYGPRLVSWSGNRVASYTGVDVEAQEAWSVLTRQDNRFQFIQADATESWRSVPTTTNLVISQSAIEHMDHDLQFFEHVRDHVRRLHSQVMQIHLCPSAACLLLYLRHGVRNYTPRTLSHITRLFEDSSVRLYRLGGRACNRLHYRFITAPLMIWRHGDFRLTRAAEYQQRLRAAIEWDMANPRRSPAFYALMIHTRPRTRVS
jgi:SAM-dependent methyltransferase